MKEKIKDYLEVKKQQRANARLFRSINSISDPRVRAEVQAAANRS